MDRRGWPWKKKPSDKSEKVAAAVESGGATSSESQGDMDGYKKPNYVQISVESYTYLTGLEDQVKTHEDTVQSLEDQIKELNERLSAAHAEITTKDNLVKQHTKVAEEAVSGWEKAEAEALALKNHLESVTLSKLTAEDRASHLDGAVKECMRQIQNLKEEHELKLQEVVLTKTKLWDKIRIELESKIVNLDQELLRSAAEYAAITRSLQERSNMLLKVTEEQSQSEAEIELLRGNIESCKREINSLKYELRIASKELEIRNEEKNMSVRSAEAAKKQHVEGVKKIARLEAECQRLRGLVRKKLPGPAALAQMKLEVENLGRDYGDSRLRRSPVKPPSPHLSPVPEFSLENAQKFHKENEFLTERLLAMEEETKMLKEALAKRNSELQASRNLCAKTTSRLQSLEAQLQNSNQLKSSPRSVVQVPVEGYCSQNASNTPSLTVLSEDGNENDRVCTDSWATTLFSELSQFKKEPSSERPGKADKSNHLQLMDDFLEMEKLACLNANGVTGITDSPDSKKSEIVERDFSGDLSSEKGASEEKSDSDALMNHPSPKLVMLDGDSGSDAHQPPFMKLQSRISALLDSVSKDTDTGKILDDVKRIVQDACDTLHHTSGNCVSEKIFSDAVCNGHSCLEDAGLLGDKEITVCRYCKAETVQAVSQELATAISQIYDFVLSQGKKAMAVHDVSSGGNGLSKKIDGFSVTFNRVLCGKKGLVDFVLDLAHVLANAGELQFNFLGYKGGEADINSPDCIDKVALPENKVGHKDSLGEGYQNSCVHISSPTSNPEVPDDGNLISGYGSGATSCKISLQEFEELKSEKENMAMDLGRSIGNLEITESQLHETKQLLGEIKSQLASAQKSNSLAETQLKCMAESYRSLEARATELVTEVNLLRAKAETLEYELQGEKKSHQDTLIRCKELQEQLQMHENCSVCSSAADTDLKTKQDKELAAAAEKLAECQETIFLLGKQLKAFCPQTGFVGSPQSYGNQKGEVFAEDEPTTTGMEDFDKADVDTIGSANRHRAGGESPVDLHNRLCSPDTEIGLLRSPISSRHPKHWSTKSTSSSSSSTPTPEEHSRGFSRFFSTKGRNGY